jgi:hypothetical protein
VALCRRRGLGRDRILFICRTRTAQQPGGRRCAFPYSTRPWIPSMDGLFSAVCACDPRLSTIRRRMAMSALPGSPTMTTVLSTVETAAPAARRWLVSAGQIRAVAAGHGGTGERGRAGSDSLARHAQRTNQPIDCVAALCRASWDDGTNREDHGLVRHQLASRNASTQNCDSGRSLGSGRLVSHLRTIGITLSTAPAPPFAVARSRSSAVRPP